MAEPLVLKDLISERRIFLDRVAVGLRVLIVLTVVLVMRLFYLQIVQHSLYSTLSDKNRIQVQPLPPIRGLITDRNGELIADNIPTNDLAIVVERIDDLETTLQEISALISLSEHEIDAFRKRLQRRRRPFEPVTLRHKLSHEEIARISVNQFAMPGVEVEARLVRHYPLADVLAHAVGSVRRINEEDLQRIDRVAYLGTDHIGKTGVERYYEDILLGKVGYQRVEINARGRVMGEPLGGTTPKPGAKLTLHVDTKLQRVASAALGDRRGAVVAIEPSTGGILALVSKPSYDPNLFVTGIDAKSFAEIRDSIDVPLFNRAVQGQYEPGSTLKPFLALIGVMTNAAIVDYTIEDPGWFKLPGSERLYRDWNWKKDGTGGHGHVNLQKAIYRSCNVYFYSLAVKLGIDVIHDNLHSFGFGENTATDVPEAASGLLPSKDWKRETRGEAWYPGDTVNIGIGQGDLLVTPLQLATAVAVLANRGKWVSPRMLRSLDKRFSWGSKQKVRPDINLDDEATWELIISAMEMVVHRGNQGFGENGTAWAHIGRDIRYRMAGKSGTAQVVGIRQGEEYEEEELDERLRKHAWFIAFAPVENPVIALVVLVENGGGGSAVAAPIARQILDEYLLRDDIHRQMVGL